MGQSLPYSVYRTVRQDALRGECTIVIVSGNDPDVVWSAALDIKNGSGIAYAPKLCGLEQSKLEGWWSCTLVWRRDARGMQ
jgi:hypothetical protein